jgi:hypothetical protein
MSSVDEYAMQPEEYAALRAQADTIAVQDNVVGRMFHAILLHLGHLHGLDPAKEDARLAVVARDTARKEEDARLQTEADARTQARAAEDQQTLTAVTPEQQTARTLARTQEDAQLEEAAKAREETRAAEDARLQEAQDAAQNQAADAQQPVAEPTPTDGPMYVAQAPVQEGN